jgi:hypothetical protein
MNAMSSHTALQEPSIYQLDLLTQEAVLPETVAYRNRLVQLLSGDLDYHGYDTAMRRTTFTRVLPGFRRHCLTSSFAG